MIVLFLFVIPIISVTSFPDHPESEDKLIDPVLHERDHKLCGLFKKASSSRAYRGTAPYEGQFPWSACLVEPIGDWAIFNQSSGETTISKSTKLTIFDISTYPWSREAGTIYPCTIKKYHPSCTASIIDDKWVMTSAHCLTRVWEGMLLLITFGTDAGLSPDGSNPDLETREIVASRMAGFQTIFEHDKWIQTKGDMYYDIALLRLQVPIDMPEDVSQIDRVNRICIYSQSLLPATGCLSNLYFAGYGLKLDFATYEVDDPTAALTYIRNFRTSDRYCDVLTEVDRKGRPCFSPVMDHANNEKLMNDPRIDKMGVPLLQMEYQPNLCYGDSGGAFTYYARHDSPNFVGGGLVSRYRAIQVSILAASTVTDADECEQEHVAHQVKRKGLWNKLTGNSEETIYIKPPMFGVNLHEFVGSEWWNNVMDNDDFESIAVRGPHPIYPSLESGPLPDY